VTDVVLVIFREGEVGFRDGGAELFHIRYGQRRPLHSPRSVDHQAATTRARPPPRRSTSADCAAAPYCCCEDGRAERIAVVGAAAASRPVDVRPPSAPRRPVGCDDDLHCCRRNCHRTGTFRTPLLLRRFVHFVRRGAGRRTEQIRATTGRFDMSMNSKK